MIDTIVNAIEYVLGSKENPRTNNYGRHIILIGGGAEIPGIDAKLLNELQKRGFPTVKVDILNNPSSFVVRGGLQVVNLLSSSHWEVLA